MVKDELEHVNVLDFDAICFRLGVSEKIQYALIVLNCITHKEGSGFKWVKGEITIDLIQSILKERHHYNGYMPPVFIDKKLNDPISSDDKYLAVVFKYYNFLQSLHKLTIQKEVNLSLQTVLNANKISANFYMFLKEHPLLFKSGSRREPIYTWNEKYTVTMDLAKDTYEWCKSKSSFYASKPKATKLGEIKQLCNSTIKNDVIVTQEPSKEQPLDNRALLAEKFALVGNYKMAESLLDQILNTH